MQEKNTGEMVTRVCQPDPGCAEPGGPPGPCHRQRGQSPKTKAQQLGEKGAAEGQDSSTTGWNKLVWTPTQLHNHGSEALTPGKGEAGEGRRCVGQVRCVGIRQTRAFPLRR